MGRVKWLHVPCLGVQVLRALFVTWKACVIWCGTDINVFLWTDHPFLMTLKVFWYYNYEAQSKDAAQWLSLLSTESGAAQTKGQLPGQASEFSLRVSFRCTLLQCSYSPCVHSHTLTSVHKLIIPSTGSHIVWLHKNTAQKYSSHYPSLPRQNVAAQVVGELETVTYVSVSGKK